MRALVTMTLTGASGLPEDSIVNNWAVDTAEDWDPTTELLEVTGPLFEFYNFLHATTGAAVAHFISAGARRNVGDMVARVYNVTEHLDGSPHGSPIAEDSSTLVGEAFATPDYPSEVAMVLTLRGFGWEVQPIETPDGIDEDALVDRPRQRYTGRVYLGPLNSGAGTTGADGKVRPTAQFRTTILDSIDRTVDQLRTNFHELSVWSRKDSAFRQVSQSQVDDAFDTQRRRGIDASVRDVRSLEP